MAFAFHLRSDQWEDFATADEMPSLLFDLWAQGTPFTIEALPQDVTLDDSSDEYGLSCLTAAERNPSLCRQ